MKLEKGRALDKLFLFNLYFFQPCLKDCLDLIDNIYEGSIKSTAHDIVRKFATELQSNCLFNWGDFQANLTGFLKEGETYLTKGKYLVIVSLL